LADIVTNEVGIVVPVRDPVAISAALSALIHDRDRRIKLGEAGGVGILNYSRWKSSSEKLAMLSCHYGITNNGNGAHTSDAHTMSPPPVCIRLVLSPVRPALRQALEQISQSKTTLMNWR
jgi:hypothetical protein